MDTCWWIASPAHHPIIKFLQTIWGMLCLPFTEPTRVETKPAGKHSTATKITSSRKKPVQTVTWSDVLNDVWQKYTLGAPEVHKIPEGYVIIEMYNTSRNENHQPVRGGALINDENYWPVKLKNRSTGHIKWVNLHSNEPTVQSIVKETTENTTEPKITYCPKQTLVMRRLYLNKYVETLFLFSFICLLNHIRHYVIPISHNVIMRLSVLLNEQPVFRVSTSS